MHDKINKL